MLFCRRDAVYSFKIKFSFKFAFRLYYFLINETNITLFLFIEGNWEKKHFPLGEIDYFLKNGTACMESWWNQVSILLDIIDSELGSDFGPNQDKRRLHEMYVLNNCNGYCSTSKFNNILINYYMLILNVLLYEAVNY